jgi:hypothetical protein
MSIVLRAIIWISAALGIGNLNASPDGQSGRQGIEVSQGDNVVVAVLVVSIGKGIDSLVEASIVWIVQVDTAVAATGAVMEAFENSYLFNTFFLQFYMKFRQLALAAWYNGHRVRLQNRRSRVQILPGCKH